MSSLNRGSGQGKQALKQPMQEYRKQMGKRENRDRFLKKARTQMRQNTQFKATGEADSQSFVKWILYITVTLMVLLILSSIAYMLYTSNHQATVTKNSGPELLTSPAHKPAITPG